MANKAPEKYTPEYCSSVYERLKMAVDAAVKALTLTTQAQRDLTSQTVKHLQETFEEIKEELHAKDTRIEELNEKISNLKVKFYAGGVTGLVFLIGFTFSIFKIIKG
jgi:predicted  nucleic acid-binding Zn-ribbon protein